MVKQPRHRLLIPFLVLCLGLSSLVLLGFLYPIHPGMLAPPGACSETQDHFLQLGTEEGFYLPLLAGVALFGLVIFSLHSISLNCRSIWLSPQIPPPKFA